MSLLENFPEPLFYAAADLIVASNNLQPTRVNHEWDEGGLSYKGDLVKLVGNGYSIRVANVLERSGENLNRSLPHGLSIRSHSRADGDLLAYLERYCNARHFNGSIGAYDVTLQRIEEAVKRLSGPSKVLGKTGGRLSALLNYML